MKANRPMNLYAVEIHSPGTGWRKQYYPTKQAAQKAWRKITPAERADDILQIRIDASRAGICSILNAAAASRD
jgi:hypothetical protein